MIKKYTFGTPFPTESVLMPLESVSDPPEYGSIQLTDGFTFSYTMAPGDIVYGLGETNRGINKRGCRYESGCSDIPTHTADKGSLYGAHNFLILSGETAFGIYLDSPDAMSFDIGFSQMNLLTIHCADTNLNFYVIDGKNAYDIAKQFRKMIGRNYIPPKFAFGFGQSRQGCRTKEDDRAVAKDCRDNPPDDDSSFYRNANENLLLHLKMMANLNMCGFLYTSADLGSFGADSSRDLLLRWLALGAFTPLMRNHSSIGTKESDDCPFENIEDFHYIIRVRYRLLPYLYSEYMKAALTDDLYCRPLAFDYPDDPVAAHIEDQLMFGHEIMIAPVYTQNAIGRHVYLPEEMILVKFLPDGNISYEILSEGNHFIFVPSNVVSFFIRSGKCIPVADAAETGDNIDPEHLLVIGYPCSSYTLYDDDGCTTDYDMEKHCRVLPQPR